MDCPINIYLVCKYTFQLLSNKKVNLFVIEILKL